MLLKKYPSLINDFCLITSDKRHHQKIGNKIYTCSTTKTMNLTLKPVKFKSISICTGRSKACVFSIGDNILKSLKDPRKSSVPELPLSRPWARLKFRAPSTKHATHSRELHRVGYRACSRTLVRSRGKSPVGTPGGKAPGSCRTLWHFPCFLCYFFISFFLLSWF